MTSKLILKVLMKDRSHRLLDPQELRQLVAENNELRRNISFYHLQDVQSARVNQMETLRGH